METDGSYTLGTNWGETDPKTLWNTYIQLTEVEDSFRTEKYDLGMPPIFHHKQDRTQAHIGPTRETPGTNMRIPAISPSGPSRSRFPGITEGRPFHLI